MQKIWKATIKFPWHGTHQIMMPEGALTLSVGIQTAPNGLEEIAIWFECDPDAPNVGRRFTVAHTGDTVPEGAFFMGTVHVLNHPNHQYVVHVYEDVDENEDD